MKKYLALGLLSSLLLTSCSVDLNDAKEKRIGELEKQVTELKSNKDLDLQKFEFEKQKYEEEKKLNQEKESQKKIDTEEELIRNYTKECAIFYKKMQDNFTNLLKTCSTSIECANQLINNPNINPQKYPYSIVNNCIEKKKEGLWKGE